MGARARKRESTTSARARQHAESLFILTTQVVGGERAKWKEMGVNIHTDRNIHAHTYTHRHLYMRIENEYIVIIGVIYNAKGKSTTTCTNR